MSELSRRDFLQRTAYAAGLAGVAGLSADTILAEAAHASHRQSGLPSGRNIPIDHFVILMMENRSFDHYFGWLGDEADATQSARYRNPQGQVVSTRHASSLGSGGVEWKGCGHPDPGHGWESGRAQLNGGFLAEGSGNDEFALCYYNRGELPLIHAASSAYTLYDRYFCSILASTYPNRFYKWSAQSGGQKDNDFQLGTAGYQHETIFDRAIPRGVSARYYNSDLPFAALFGPRAGTWVNPISRYYADCAAGTLPNITIVDPPFTDGGGGDGLSADEHPLGDVRLGQAFTADVVNAFVRSPNYRRGALFLIYDEWGGFFDHVRPPRTVDDRMSRNPLEDFGQMGFRVPAVSISPYTRSSTSGRVRVDHGIYGHESILKLISQRFGLGFLTKRHRYARNIGHSFDWARPNFDPPALPDPPQVATAPCGGLGGDDVIDRQDSHASDLAELEAAARRFDIPMQEGRPDQVFSEPSALLQALGLPGVGLP